MFALLVANKRDREIILTVWKDKRIVYSKKYTENELYNKDQYVSCLCSIVQKMVLCEKYREWTDSDMRYYRSEEFYKEGSSIVLCFSPDRKQFLELEGDEQLTKRDALKKFPEEEKYQREEHQEDYFGREILTVLAYGGYIPVNKYTKPVFSAWTSQELVLYVHARLAVRLDRMLKNINVRINF